MTTSDSHEYAPPGSDEAALGASRLADHRTNPRYSLVRLFCDLVWQPIRDVILEAYNKQDYPLGYSPGLDGLRGFMTLGVMAAHIDVSMFPGIEIFMDIFFVMSGYFITGLLIKDVQLYGRVRFFQFYRRRFRRLLPPLMAMVAVFLIFSYFYLPDFKTKAIDAAIGFFYIANWWRAFEWPGIRYMGHTWSLATEEQFYLLWPLTFLILYRFFGIGRRMVGVILMIALTIFAWRFWLTWQGASFRRLYNGFDTRADALMIGCALAVVLTLVSAEYWSVLDRFFKKLAWPIIVVVLGLTLIVLDYRGRLYYYAGIEAGGVVGAILIVILIRPLDTVLHRGLERRELAFLGRIFYAMYLWHFPIFIVFQDDFGWPSWLRAVVGFPLTIAIAVLSYVLIERHFMRTKARGMTAAVDQTAHPSTVPVSISASR
jgi:peptidoglycan/LPS O-acetylase OafA/YrhL